MSIINEALKKASREKEFQKSPDTLHKHLEVERARKTGSWKTLFGILVVLLIAVPLTAPFLAGPTKQSPKTNPPVTRKAQFGVEEIPSFGVPSAPIPRRPTLNLSGVVYSSPSDAYCIINNQIARVGDTVDGAKLTNISMKEIMLDYRDEKVVLEVGD